jgi:hypothetical protein
MSLVKVRAALEQALATITPAVATAYENVAYSPVAGVPYQSAYLLPAATSNPTAGDGFYRLQGIFQVNVFYPLMAGNAAAATQAEKIQALFKRGATFTYGGVTVQVITTPTIGSGSMDIERWMIPIKVSWQADIFA